MTPLEKIIDHHKYLPEYLRYRAGMIEKNYLMTAKATIKVFLSYGYLPIHNPMPVMDYDTWLLVSFPKVMVDKRIWRPTGSNK